MATPAQEINYFAAVTLTDGRQYATLAYIRADLGFYMGWNQADQNDRFAAFYQVTEEDYYYKKYTFFYQYQNESPWYGFGYTSDTFGYYYAWNSQQSQQYFLGLFLMTGEGNFTYLYNFAGGGLYMGQGYAQPDSGYCYAFPIGNAAVYTMTSYTLTSGVQSMPFLGYWTLINSGSLLDYYD
jgi:hypothetical protein